MNPTDKSGERRVGGRGDGPEEKIGYGRPPKQHRFKKGVSGNPRGRRRGVKNQATMLREILHRLVSINENGSRTRVPVMQAILLRFADAALRGDTKAATFLFNRLAAVHDPVEDIDWGRFSIRSDMTDEEASERYAQRLRQLKASLAKSRKR